MLRTGSRLAASAGAATIGAGRGPVPLGRDAVPDQLLGVEAPRTASPRPSRSPASRNSSSRTLSTPADTSWLSVTGLPSPWPTAFAIARRMKICCRVMRPRSAVPSLLPLAVVVLVLEVPRSDELPGLLTVEHLALRLGHRRDRCACRAPARRTTSGCRPTASTSRSKPDEVDLDVVVDRDAEVVLDRVDQRLLAVGVGAVDAARCLPVPRDRDPQVAGEREDARACFSLGSTRSTMIVSVQLHPVSPSPVKPAGVRVVGVEALAAVGADEQVVRRLARPRPPAISMSVHPVDLRQPHPEVAGARRPRRRSRATTTTPGRRARGAAARCGHGARGGRGRHHESEDVTGAPGPPPVTPDATWQRPWAPSEGPAPARPRCCAGSGTCRPRSSRSG